MRFEAIPFSGWKASRSEPIEFGSPSEALAELDASGEWIDAAVPGTVAQALDAVGRWTEGRNLDDEEWWYRTEFYIGKSDGGAEVETAEPVMPIGGGGATSAVLRPYRIVFNGLATVCDAWVDDLHLLHSENMFRRYEVDCNLEPGVHTLALRFSRLTPLLKPRKPRPRWRTYLVSNQSLRWVRTSLLGRMPEWTYKAIPVGPYRPIEIFPLPARTARLTKAAARVEPSGDEGKYRGVVSYVIKLEGAFTPEEFLKVRLGSEESTCEVNGGYPAGIDAQETADCPKAEVWEISGEISMEDPDLWWPHTHGEQPLYPLSVVVDGEELHLRDVGFKSTSVDRADGKFSVSINGVEVFCRGAGWMPLDPVTIQDDLTEAERTLRLFAEANLNMVRFVGTTVYPAPFVLDLCDRIGIMVWQDCMFAHMDPPDDPAFKREVSAELTQMAHDYQGRPSLTIVCGSAEMEEQATMLGLSDDDWNFPIFDSIAPEIFGEMLGQAHYVRSTPTGGPNPTVMNEGLSHYFGVGGFLLPLEDPRRAQVKFASECLMFSIPPEEDEVDEMFGGPHRAGHDPKWKQTLHRDTGRSSDTEDVVNHYKRVIFGVEPNLLRHGSASRALDLARATVCECMEQVLGEFRRPGSPCRGSLLMALRDIRPGAGFGVVDAMGNPKAPWYVLKRLFDPIGLILTDERLNGLSINVLNDTCEVLSGELSISLFNDGHLKVESVTAPVSVDSRSGLEISSSEMFGSFRDVTYAYRFGTPVHDLVVVELKAKLESSGEEISRLAYFFPLGHDNSTEFSLGLNAVALPRSNGEWCLRISAERVAKFVSIEAKGFRPDDSWFHLAPGLTKEIILTPEIGMGPERHPVGKVRAINSKTAAQIAIGEAG